MMSGVAPVFVNNLHSAKPSGKTNVRYIPIAREHEHVSIDCVMEVTGDHALAGPGVLSRTGKDYSRWPLIGGPALEGLNVCC